MNSLRFQFKVSECNGWPKLKFLIDDDLYHDYEFTSEVGSVELPLDLVEGIHKLEIELYGKTHNNTIVVDDTIVKDQLVTLDEIFIDDVKLPNFIKYLGVYKVGEAKNPQALTWGLNGIWVLIFEHPIIDWVLNLKLNYTDEHARQAQWATSTNHPKKNELLTDGLGYLREILVNVKD
jgi:hypothetical protein